MNYKALNNNIFELGNHKIIPLRLEDMESIRVWRNEQMAVLRQKAALTPEGQILYFQNVVSPLFDNPQPTQLLFSFLENEQLIGYGGLVNISWQDKRAEMSFLVNPTIANDKVAYKKSMSIFISLIKKLVFEEMQFNRLFTETYEFRDYHISILVENGYKEEGRMREHILEFGKFNDSILHSILKSDFK